MTHKPQTFIVGTKKITLYINSNPKRNNRIYLDEETGEKIRYHHKVTTSNKEAVMKTMHTYRAYHVKFINPKIRMGDASNVHEIVTDEELSPQEIADMEADTGYKIEYMGPNELQEYKLIEPKKVAELEPPSI